MASVILEGLCKSFGQTVALAPLDLEVAPGEFLALLGPSGCGKTTLLRLIAGFEEPSAGRILVAGEDVVTLPPERRGIGMVFQSYALFPHLTVFGNVAFGLEARSVPAARRRESVGAALVRVGLGDKAQRPVAELSGGEQQRVALARAIVIEPRILLLDEPLSNLDAALRQETRVQIRSLQRQLGITTLYVTHDQEEALAIADRVAVMNQGRLLQTGRPWEVYARPATRFVAGFLGRSTFLEARVAEASGALPGTSASPVAPGAPEGLLRLECPALGRTLVVPSPDPAPQPGAVVVLMIRPEQVGVGLAQGRSADPGAEPPAAVDTQSDKSRPGEEVLLLDGRLEAAEFLGPCWRLEVRVGELRLQALASGREAGGLGGWAPGQALQVRLPLGELRVLPRDS